MQKPDEIPQDIWDAANVRCDLTPESTLRLAIARAIMAERENTKARMITKQMHSEAKIVLAERDRCKAALGRLIRHEGRNGFPSHPNEG